MDSNCLACGAIEVGPDPELELVLPEGLIVTTILACTECAEGYLTDLVIGECVGKFYKSLVYNQFYQLFSLLVLHAPP